MEDGKESIKKLEDILKNLSDKKVITHQRLTKLYGYMENTYDEDLQFVEDALLREIQNKNKQEDLMKLVSELDSGVQNGYSEFK